MNATSFSARLHIDQAATDGPPPDAQEFIVSEYTPSTDDDYAEQWRAEDTGAFPYIP